MLVVNHVSKRWKDFAIDDISFQLEPGFIMGLIGRNGAGKTTLMNMLLGAYKMDSGKVSIMGYSLERETVKAKQQIGFILDQSPFLEERTIDENVRLFSKFYPNWDKEVFLNYKNQFQLRSKKTVEQLSKGMQIKLQLAFALAHHPKLLIMDEPTGGLDPLFRKEFLHLLQSLVEKENMSVLISTHVTSDLDRVADYITMIDEGKLLFSKSKEELMDECYVVKGAVEDKDILIGVDAISCVQKRGRFEALIQDRDLAERLKEQTHIPVVVDHASLEDIMYYRTRRNG